MKPERSFRFGDHEDGGSTISSSSNRSSSSKHRGLPGQPNKYWVPKPKVVVPPPPIVSGYAEEGMDAMPSTGIDNVKRNYQCYVCNIFTSTEEILNTHLCGKNHIKKLEQAGHNSFLPPVPLGPIPAIEAIKDKKWETGEKRKYSEIDPTNNGHFVCRICDIEFDSRVVYQTHLDGKKHARKEKLEREKTTPNGLVCDICNLEFDSKVVLDNHLEGKKHKRMLVAIEETKNEDPNMVCNLCMFIATSAIHMDTHIQGKNHKKRVEQERLGMSGGRPPVSNRPAYAVASPPYGKKQRGDDHYSDEEARGRRGNDDSWPYKDGEYYYE